MGLEIFLNTEQFNGLADEQKSLYKLHDGKYELEGIGAKVRGLQDDNKRFEGFKGLNAEEAKKAVDTLKSLGGEFDAEMLKAALATHKKVEEKKLIDKGDYDKALGLKENEYNTNLSKVNSELDSFKSGFLQEKLALKLIEKGVLADRVNYAQMAIAPNVETVMDNGKLDLQIKSGIGNAASLDELIEGMKATSPFFFAPNGASGSGASGSEGNGGGTGGTNRSAMTVAEKSAYVAKHGQEAYNKLPN